MHTDMLYHPCNRCQTIHLQSYQGLWEAGADRNQYRYYFFPFDKIDFRKKDIESGWSTDSPERIALIMTMKNKPQAVMMSFQKEYAESYDWLIEVFRDWAFTFFSGFLYYQDYDKLEENERSLYRQGMANIWRCSSHLSHRTTWTPYLNEIARLKLTQIG